MKQTKPVQFPMKPAAYDVLKKRAKTLGISTGQMVENLLASMELRLGKAYETVGLMSVSDRRDELDLAFMSLILAYDRDGTLESMRIDHELTKEIRLIDEISAAAKEIQNDTRDTEWTPTIDIPRDKFRGAHLRKDGRGATWWEGDGVTPEDEKAIGEELKKRRKKAADNE